MELTRPIKRFTLAALIIAALPLAAADRSLAERKETNTSVALPVVDGYAVYADTAEVTSELQATTTFPFEARVEFGNCAYPVAATLAADASAIVTDLGKYLCGPRIGVTRVRATNAAVSTFVTWSGARRTGYEIPLLTHAIGSGNGSEVRLLTNPGDGGYGTSLLIFNVGAKAARVTARVYDDEHPLLYRDEQFMAAPHGVLTWYDIQTRFRTGRVLLAVDRALTPNAEVYGFAAIGTPFGDAPRVRPIAERIVIPAPPRPNP